MRHKKKAFFVPILGKDCLGAFIMMCECETSYLSATCSDFLLACLIFCRATFLMIKPKKKPEKKHIAMQFLYQIYAIQTEALQPAH